MHPSKCPHCKAKLGNYLYADACPHCQHELLHNTRPLVPAAAIQARHHTAWPFRLLRNFVRLVES